MATEVGSGYVSLIPSARGFGTRLNREIGPDIDRSGRSSGRTFGSVFARTSLGPIRAGFGSIGRLAAGAFAGIAAGGFLKSTIDQASDLNETLSKVSVVLGKDALPGLQKFAKGAARSIGQSEQAALDATATFAVFGKSAGLQGPQLSKFSTKLTTLASDMASFSNTSPEDAITAIGAALRGESEPIRAYGVLLDDASLRQEALRQGLIETTKTALTPQQRVLAAQALIFKQTSDAQGDFARTSSGLANQQRILSAQFTNLKARIGTAFLPVALRVVRFMNEQLLPAFANAKDTVGGLFAAFKSGLQGNVSGSGVFRVASRIGDTVGGLVSFLESIEWRALAHRAVDGIKAGLRGGAAVWNRLQPDLTAFGQALFDGAKQTAGELIDGLRVGLETGNWEPLGLAITAGLGRTATGAKGIASAVGTWVKSVDWLSLGKTSAAALVPFVIGLVNGLAGAFFDTALAHPLDVALFLTAFIPIGRAAGVLEKIFGRLPIAGPLLRSLATAGRGVEGGIMRFIVRPLGRIGGFILNALVEGFRLIFPRAGAELSHQLALLPLRIAAFGIRMALAGGRLVARLAEGIAGQVRLVGAQIGLLLNTITRPFRSTATLRLLFNFGVNIVRGLINGIRSMAASAASAALDVVRGAYNAAKDFLKIGSPSKLMHELGVFVGEGFANGIIRTRGQVTQAAVDMAQRALDAVKNKLADARADLQGLRESVRDAVLGTLDVGSLRGGLGAMFDLRSLASRAGQFVAALQTLAKRKLSPALIEAIAQAGPDAGLSVAQTFANYSPKQLKDVNRSFGRLETFSGQAATVAGRVSGLTEQVSELREIKEGIHALVRKRERDLNVTIELDDGSAPKTVRRKKLAATF